MRPRPSVARAPRPMWLGVLLAVCALLLAGAPPVAAVDRQVVVAGGDVIYAGSGGTCVVGFNAEKGGDPYGIVPGHCAGTDTNLVRGLGADDPHRAHGGRGFPHLRLRPHSLHQHGRLVPRRDPARHGQARGHHRCRTPHRRALDVPLRASNPLRVRHRAVGERLR